MRRMTAFALLLLLVPALSACAPAAEDSSEGGYGLWFAVSQDSERSGSSAVAREDLAWEGEPTAQELVEALLAGPVTDGLRSPFPKGVEVRSITIDKEKSSAQVNLSEQYGGLAGYDLTIADYCIALTLCQLPDIKTVTVLVEGEDIPYRDRQTLQAGDVLLSGISEEPETFFAALYFPNRNGSGLRTEYRQVTRTGGADAVEMVISELLRGPADEEENLPLPTGVQVRSLAVSGGVCRINLSEEFLSNAPESEEQAGLMLYALVNTLCALGEVNQVQLLVEGEPLDSYGGVSASEPLNANFELVQAS